MYSSREFWQKYFHKHSRINTPFPHYTIRSTYKQFALEKIVLRLWLLGKRLNTRKFNIFMNEHYWAFKLVTPITVNSIALTRCYQHQLTIFLIWAKIKSSLKYDKLLCFKRSWKALLGLCINLTLWMQILVHWKKERMDSRRVGWG